MMDIVDVVNAAIKDNKLRSSHLEPLIAELKQGRDLERQYSQQLGEMARLSDVVCGYILDEAKLVPFDVLMSAGAVAEYCDAVRPPAGSKDPEWVMHIIGPDDVIDMPSQFAALKAANDHNKAFAKLMEDDPSPNWPYCVALAKNRATESV